MVMGDSKPASLLRKSVASCCSWPAAASRKHQRTASVQSETPVSDHARVKYEDELRSAKNHALFVASLLKASRFFGICALTWATVVLLGGFASTLKLLDFYLISILLLLEAARLSTTEFFSKLLTKTFFREGKRPETFEFKDLQDFWAARLDLVGLGFTGLLGILSFTFAVVRVVLSARYTFTERDHDDSSDSLGNISISLYTFYLLVALNAASAIVSCFLRPFLRRSSEDSLTSYHDEVYKVAITSSSTDADDINIFDFAFKKLAGDYMRNIRPVTIKARNGKLIKFIYGSENGVGVTCEHLKSSDAWKQVVAAGLPGFWAEEAKIEKQVALFWALQDRLYSAGKVAEVAANSICSLSKAWALQEDKLNSAGKVAEVAANSVCSLSKARADNRRQHPFLIVNPNRGNVQTIVDSLIYLILHPIQSSLLFLLRGLEGCCRSSQVLKHIYKLDGRHHTVLRPHLQNMVLSALQQQRGPAHQNASTPPTRPEELCLKLVEIVNSKSHIRQTTRMFAASILHAILCYEGQLEREALASFAALVQEKLDLTDLKRRVDQEGSHSPYVWLDEKTMFDKLRTALGLEDFGCWHEIRVLGPDGKDMDLSMKSHKGRKDAHEEV